MSQIFDALMIIAVIYWNKSGFFHNDLPFVLVEYIIDKFQGASPWPAPGKYRQGAVKQIASIPDRL